MSHGGRRDNSGRPRISDARKLRIAAFSLKPDTIKWVHDQASLADMSKSKFVRLILERHQRNDNP